MDSPESEIDITILLTSLLKYYSHKDVAHFHTKMHISYLPVLYINCKSVFNLAAMIIETYAPSPLRCEPPKIEI